MITQLTQPQLGIYLASLNQTDEENYNVAQYYHLPEGTDLELMAKAIERFVELHPYLKGRIFIDDEGTVCMESHDDEKFTCPIIAVDDFDAIKDTLNVTYPLLGNRLFELAIYRDKNGRGTVYSQFSHTIFDGASLKIFTSEVSAIYNGTAENLIAENYTGHDISNDEQALRKSDTAKQAREWFLKEYGDVQSVPLPEGDRSGNAEFVKEKFPIKIDAKALKIAAKRNKVGRASFFNAAFAYLLSCYTNESTVPYNTVCSGRENSKVGRSVTMMVRTLPVSLPCPPNRSISELLQHSEQQTNISREYSTAYSFADLTHDTALDNKVNFVFQGYVYSACIKIGTFETEYHDLRKHEIGFELNCELMLTAEGEYQLQVSYDANKYSHEYIAQMMKCYENIVNNMASAEPDAILADVSLLSDEEKENVMALSTGESLEYDASQTFVDLFKQRVAEQPEHIAVADRDAEVTYATLDKRSDILADALLKAGVEPDEFVALMMDRSIEFPLSVLAIHKVGAAYTPLDVDYPNERLSYMLENSSAKVLITKHAVLEAKIAEGDLEIGNVKVIYIDDIDWYQKCDPITPKTTPKSLAYMIYTSGSTGKPKGVMLHQAGLLNFTHSMMKIEQLTNADRTASHRSFSFDAHIGDIYPILAAGGELHIMPSEIRKDLQAMADFIESRKINGTGGTTSLMMLLINSFPQLPLRFITAGGEKLSGVSSDSMSIINLYGPTECTNDSTTFTIKPGEVYDNIPIGRPMPNMQCFIMSASGQLLPQGVPGELVIAGVQVGRGYWKLPEKTEEAFVVRNGIRMYRTGDLARYNKQGQIEYLGRIDGQVKLRGYRIELGEIDAVSGACAGVHQSASQVREVAGQRHLVLYYTKEEGASLTEKELKQHIEASSLAEYMHPEIYVELDEMPLLPNGKINRKALPTPSEPEDGTEVAENIELNALELEVKDIIASAVGTDKIGLTTPLAKIGLTSLSSIKLSVLLYKRYNLQIDSKWLVAEGSLRTIANAIIVHLLNAPAQQQQNVEKEVRTFAPLSFPQQGVYFDILKNPENVAYNIPTCIELGKSVNSETVAAAIATVVKAHPILSSHFETRDGETVQVLPENVKPEVEVLEMNDFKFAKLKEQFVKPFNAETGPFYRANVVTTPSGTIVLLDFLHLVMDGASLGIFIRQLTDVLNGATIEQEPYNYIEYVYDELESRKSKEFEESKNFFAQKMTTVDGASCIPEDIKSGEDVQGMLKFASAHIDMEAVNKFAVDLGVTPAAVFLAATNYAVSRYTNTPDVCIATISNGRGNVKVSDTVGMFVNTIALTSHITDVSVEEFIKATAQEFNDSLSHENYPFAELSAAFDLHPDVFYQYQVGMRNVVKVNGAEAAVSHFGNPQPKFKMIVSIEEGADGVRIEMQYDDSCYTKELAQGFADATATVLRNFINNPQARLKKVSMLSDAQKALIDTFHETAREDIPIKLYHKLFEKSAETHSDKLALVAIDGEFTYDALNKRMNRLAHALIERGIKRGDRIAILLPRISSFIVSQYGIMKAGGAYIPCDPKYPTDRINHILDDSAAPFIITTSDRVDEFPGRAVDVEELLQNTNEENPDVYVEPDDLAYLIYTSGSTGTPKGVQLMHKGVCNYHCKHNLIQGILNKECNTALAITTVSFDMSVWETGSPLMLGKTLVFVGDDDCNDPNALAALINKYHIDCMTATTSRFMQLLESDEFHYAFNNNMHLAYQGGEGLSTALLKKLQSFKNLRIVNGYGPTETIANSHASELTEGDIPHIGKPCINYTNFIVDADGNELPVGVIGELLIGGASVAKGYNNLPEQTAARFVDGVYHSGDYARWLPDGNVMVLGRKDNQVKLRGLRIELGEVESTMVKVDGIKSAVVMIKKLNGKDHLCAYFTANREIDIADLKAELRKTLTLYMVPTAYLQVDEFPLTPNGKTNVKVLPDPIIAQATDYVEASNKVEEDFCHIFASVLQLEKVGATDNFFELGGTSLVVIKVVIEATKLGYKVAFQDVFANPTPRDLAIFTGAVPAAETNSQPKEEFPVASLNTFTPLLAQNTIDNFRSGERMEIGDVLLTGATGYLGIHILYHLLTEYDVKVYCPIRGKDGVKAEERLMTMLYYYFEQSFEELLNNRLIIVETNVMDVNSLMKLEYRNLTVINCLANVKHFSTGNDIEEVNVNSVRNLIQWCVESDSRLVHVSTISVAGHKINGIPAGDVKLSEQQLDFGQVLDNQYAHSKYVAEQIILEAIEHHGLSAKIMRVGNLSARNADGEFQMNFQSNNFMATLRAYQTLGACSFASLDQMCEFSPIDEVSRAILLLATTPKENIVFHPTNNHRLPMGDVLKGMRNINEIKAVEEDELKNILLEASNESSKVLRLRPLMAYAGSAGTKVEYIDYDNRFTTQVLHRLGFSWPYTSWDYVERFIKSLAGLDFFDL